LIIEQIYACLEEKYEVLNGVYTYQKALRKCKQVNKSLKKFTEAFEEALLKLDFEMNLRNKQCKFKKYVGKTDRELGDLYLKNMNKDTRKEIVDILDQKGILEAGFIEIKKWCAKLRAKHHKLESLDSPTKSKSVFAVESEESPFVEISIVEENRRLKSQNNGMRAQIAALNHKPHKPPHKPYTPNIQNPNNPRDRNYYRRQESNLGSQPRRNTRLEAYKAKRSTQVCKFGKKCRHGLNCWAIHTAEEKAYFASQKQINAVENIEIVSGDCVDIYGIKSTNETDIASHF
ncbi:MAG: hypothetical protein GY818_16855, partial [Planctomycetaceae bacterium]|nr:hypothetical protein [Planctomycetaceae bacterium]